MKCLVTGFGLWADATLNPSWEMIKDLPNKVGSHEIVKAKYSVSYGKIESEIKNAIDQNRPDIIISFGLSGSLFKPRVESYGWNLAGSGKDADGVDYTGRLNKNLDAKFGYKVTYEYEQVQDWIRGTNHQAEASVDPGKFICNASMYYTLQYLRSKGLDTPYMFIHVPKETTYGMDKLKDFAKVIIQKAFEINDQPFDWSLAGGDTQPVEPTPPTPESPVEPKPSGNNAIESNLITNAKEEDYIIPSTDVGVGYKLTKVMPKDRVNYLFRVKINSEFEGETTVHATGFSSTNSKLKIGEHEYEFILSPALTGRDWDRANLANAINLKVSRSDPEKDKNKTATIKGGSVEFGKLVDQSYTPSN